MKRSLLLFVITLFSMFTCNAQFFKVHDFKGASGSAPCGSLLSFGTFLYGMNSYGGLYSFHGTIFKSMSDGTGDSTVFNFNGANGSIPVGTLITDGTFFYGMTSMGGTNNFGTIFRINPDGTNHTILLNFNGAANGSTPYGSLISDGTYLYGTTSMGGTSDFGTVFKIKLDGTGYTKLLDFQGSYTLADGKNPKGTLISDGTYLYGTTRLGGTAMGAGGTIFKIKTDGTAFASIFSFDYWTTGGFPFGSFISDGTYLYGMTSGGGTASDDGTIYKIKTDGTGFTKLLDFNGTNGRNPHGSLISDGTFLYGMTRFGGANDFGTIFKIMPSGTGYLKLLDFDGEGTGKEPLYGPLYYDGSYLYGMAELAGPNGFGTLFKLMTDGTGFNRLLNFDGINGGFNPVTLITDSTYLYGSTSKGGTYGYGTLFKIKTDGTGHTKLLNFNDTVTGSAPKGALFSDGTYLYGMAEQGGLYNYGTIFKIKLDGTGDTVIFAFDSVVSGSNPKGALISDGTFLYGMTEKGGANGYGTIFKILPDGTGYLKLLDFNTVNGRYPCGSLVYDGTSLYGVTREGGTYWYGTIFKIEPDGTGYIKYYDFGATGGRYPLGQLFLDGIYLYGTTSGGSSAINFGGTIFKIKIDGTGYTSLMNFSNTGVYGLYPYSSLNFDGTFLYGTTRQGGTAGYGTVFKMKPSGGATFAIVMDLTGIDGKYPTGSLVSDGNFIYGTTEQGGENEFGTIFKFTDCFAQYSTSYDSTLNSFTLIVDSVTTATALSYLWDFGDGVTSTLATPSHVYTVDSLYNVCMKIYTLAGDSCSYCRIIGKDTLGNIMREGGFTINVYDSEILTTVSQNSSNEPHSIIFPNPSSGIFEVKFDKEQYKNAELSVYNVIGEKVYSRESEELNDITIDLSDQPNGIYFLQVKTGSSITTKKIIISK